MAVLAPGRFSITTGCPQSWLMRCPITRARMSVGPPAGNGTMMRMGRLGNALAASAASSAPAGAGSRPSSARTMKADRRFGHMAFSRPGRVGISGRHFNQSRPWAKMPPPLGFNRRKERGDIVLARNALTRDRYSMYNTNKLKIGLFGCNTSSGRAVTMVPERWSGSWPDNLRLARMADEAGIDFMLPIGRWKGYGGDTDYQGATLETITRPTGLLASTKRVTVFGTVHAPLFHPIIAAKEMVTADHIGEGRFGLNIVVGWNEGEFAMFGVKQRDHEARYEYAQEWIDV